MKTIKLFEEFINENSVVEGYEGLDTNSRKDDADAALKELYNGIKNDHSTQRYSLGWKSVIEALDKKFINKIEKSNVDFTKKLLSNAILAVENAIGSDHKGFDKLKDVLEAFARELDINIKTLHQS